MTRSVLVVDTYYINALARLGYDKKFTEPKVYQHELARASEFGFGTGGAYVRALRGQGWESSIIIPNSLALQDLWAQEHGLHRPISPEWNHMQILARPPVFRDVLKWVPHAHRILLQQVRDARPDVLLVQDINAVPPSLVRQFKKYAGVVIGEIASPPPPKPFLTCYDRILSALPSIVDRATSLGIPSTFVPLGFDKRWATFTDTRERDIDVVFVGSFSRLQPTTAPLLRAIAEAVPTFRLYGTAKSDVLKNSGLQSVYHGPVWGEQMFEILGNSKIVINRHGTIAGSYAVNMRMYESTGSGAALVTEQKSNLGELFAVGEEVLGYSDITDAVQQTSDLLQNPGRLSQIARAGQQRTLSDHTYDNRAEQLIRIFETDLLSRSSR